MLKKLSKGEKEHFLRDLAARLEKDNREIAQNERLAIVEHCFGRTVNSVVMQMPDLEELYAYKKCIRKYARAKMQAINVYNFDLYPGTNHLEKDLEFI